MYGDMNSRDCSNHFFYVGVGIWETMDDHNVTENNVSGNDIEKENCNVSYYSKLLQKIHYRGNKINA